MNPPAELTGLAARANAWSERLAWLTDRIGAALLLLLVFGAAGIVYLVVNGLLTLLMRLVEHKALAFERRN